MIPSLLHFIWIQGWETCPDHFKENVEVCSKKSGVVIEFWDDEKIRKLLKNTTDFLQLYDEENVMAAKADIARYAIVYQKGGVYLDIDMQCLGHIQHIFQEICPHVSLMILNTDDTWSAPLKKYILHNNILNGVFGASPKHPLFLNLLEKCRTRRHHRNITYRTGTNLFTLTVREHLASLPSPRQEIFFLPRIYFHPIDMFHPSKCKDCHHAITLHENTFTYNRGHKFISTMAYKKMCLVLILLLILILVGCRCYKTAVVLMCFLVLVCILGSVFLYWSRLFHPSYTSLSDGLHIIKDQHEDYDKIMIVAHPDDEILFGGLGLLREPGWKVVCVTNGNNKKRREAFIRAMEKIPNVYAYTLLNHKDQYFGTTMNSQLEMDLQDILKERPYKKIATHNYRGEYGHRQHILLHNIVERWASSPLYVFVNSQGGYGTASTKEKETLMEILTTCYPMAPSKHIPAASHHILFRIR